MERETNSTRRTLPDRVPRRAPDLDQIPTDLREVDELLEEMASAETAGVPSGLNERIFDATRGAIVARESRPMHVGSVRGSPIPVSARLAAPMRLAAGLALAGTLGVAWLAGRGPGGVHEVGPDSQAAVDQDIATWLAVSEASYVGDLQTQLTALDAEASALVRTFEAGESQESWYDDSLSGAAGGAM